LSKDATPVDSEKKTRGTTISFKDEIKIEPIVSNKPLTKYILIISLLFNERTFINNPVKKPKIIPVIIFTVKDIL
jgi:hypothetical protein